MYILLYRLTNCSNFEDFFVQRMTMSIEYVLFSFRLQSTFLYKRAYKSLYFWSAPSVSMQKRWFGADLVHSVVF